MIQRIITVRHATEIVGKDWLREILEAVAKGEIETGEYGAEIPGFPTISKSIKTQSLRDYFIKHYGRDLLAEAEKPSDMASPSGKAPYMSEELSILNQAAKRFWGNADPNERDTQPIKQVVINWLTKDHQFSKAKAEAGAAIIRPEWAADGRPPEK